MRRGGGGAVRQHPLLLWYNNYREHSCGMLISQTWGSYMRYEIDLALVNQNCQVMQAMDQRFADPLHLVRVMIMDDTGHTERVVFETIAKEIRAMNLVVYLHGHAPEEPGGEVFWVTVQSEHEARHLVEVLHRATVDSHLAPQRVMSPKAAAVQRLIESL